MVYEKIIREMIEKLNKAADVYYNTGHEIMSDYEYDQLFDQLKEMEQETGIIFPDSPTQKVGANISEDRERVIHEFPAKSLDKTKSKEELVAWLKNKLGILSWKMDGMTVVSTYEDGKLKMAVTRGNGEVGTNITDVAPYIKGLPLTIDFKEKLVVRGEVVISYETFNRINDNLAEGQDKYKNPRNLVSGTITALDHSIHEDRTMNYFVFEVVYSDTEISNSFSERLNIMKNLGFGVVEFIKTINPEEDVEKFEERVESNPFPSDGLVLTFDDVSYGRSLGMTGHHPKHSIAFKWADECVETTLRDIEWSPSKTGLLNPVAIFDSVEIEGTTVSRASIHNVSILQKLQLGLGDKISVYKANMIIPQIAENLTRSDTYKIPSICPVCGEKTEIKLSKDDVMTLHCTNPDCVCKRLGKLEHFVSRNAMDIDGVSGKTIELLYNEGFLFDFHDFYSLYTCAEEIKKLNGMGELAVSNMLTAIEKSKNTTLAKFINALSIPMVGTDTSKLIAAYCQDDIDEFKEVLNNADVLLDVSGIGDVVVDSLKKWISNRENYLNFSKLHDLLYFEKKEKASTSLNGLTFVITGSVNHFANRDELKKFIEDNGGKTAGSVSKNTSYLINNDVTSSSGKNKKAKELNIPIISEEDFLKLI